ncbi:hypothetical protein [Sorangium sp. So ce1099]|uniref:hypothetical protein n=1 Tax=Sorangium sp. So ce1099 TaxID=3133331 RepID=UPI003F62B84F
MSTAHQDTHAAAAHDASDHHGFDGEPAHALPADEPPTPNWVPALGLAVFVVAGVTFLATSSDGGDAGQAAPASPRAVDARPADARPATPANERPTAPANARPTAPADVRPGARPVPPTGPTAGAAAETLRAAAAASAAPAAPGSANLRKLTPEEVEKVRRQIQEARQKEGAQRAPAPPK